MEPTAISKAREYSKNIREMGNGFNKMEPGAGDVYIKTANVIDDLVKEYEKTEVSLLEKTMKNHALDQKLKENATYYGIMKTLIGKDANDFIFNNAKRINESKEN